MTVSKEQIAQTLIGFQIAKRHEAVVAKYLEGSIDRYDLQYELNAIKELADENDIPYVVSKNFLNIIAKESQYECDSYESSEEESSEYY